MSLEVFVATKNAGKIREIKDLLADLPIKLTNAGDFPEIIEPEETGETFVENATLKAKYYSQKTGLWALADDSGLEIEALNWRPGIFSARYAGADATNAEKIAKILNEMEQTASPSRLARFVCSMVLVDEKGEIRVSAFGICEGKIALEPVGDRGFGYDPIFIPARFSETFGELSDAVKRQISHRAQAIGEIITYLKGFLRIGA